MFNKKKYKLNFDQEASLLAVGIYLSSRFVIWLLIPIGIAWLFGNFLDKKFNTGKLFFFTLLSFAFIISNIGIAREAMIVMKNINNFSKTKKSKSKKSK